MQLKRKVSQRMSKSMNTDFVAHFYYMRIRCATALTKSRYIDLSATFNLGGSSDITCQRTHGDKPPARSCECA